jgi:hypothetical protein
MPGDPGIKCWAEFPSVDAIESCSYTRSLGIAPGVVTMKILPQPDFTIAAGGDVVFHYGDETRVVPSCKVDQGSYTRNEGGFIVTLSLWDRRWKWMFGGPFGPLSGQYNILEEVGTIKENFSRKQLRTPRALAVLCLEAMGEVGYDVSAVPDDPYNDLLPETLWDREIPAKALAALCDEIGFTPAYRVSDDTVRLYELGQGEDLPTEDIEDQGIKVNPPERPDSLMVACGPTLFQIIIPLEAVGKDIDGTIKPISKLSYKPANGWSYESPAHMINVDLTQLFLPDGTSINRRTLAQQTVFRWYRILNQAVDFDSQDGLFDGPPLAIPGVPAGLGAIQDLRQILPMDDQRIETWIDPRTQQERKLRMCVFGIYCKGADGNLTNTKSWLEPVDRDATLNGDLGIVEFDRYVVKTLTDKNGNLTITGANIYLQIAVKLRHPITWAWWRYERLLVYPDGAWGTGPRVLKHDDIVEQVQVFYDKTTKKIVKFETNNANVNAECDYYLAAADQEYQSPNGLEVLYMGLKQIDIDGAIRQVEWSVGPEGFTTRACRNSEFAVGTIPLKQRRLQERMLQRDVIQEVDELRKRAKAQGGR